MVNTPQLAPSASTSSTSKLLIARKRYCFYLYYHTHSLLVCIHTYPVTHSVEYSELRTETLVDRVRDWTFHYSAQAPYSHKSGSETNDQQTTSLIAHPPTHVSHLHHILGTDRLRFTRLILLRRLVAATCSPRGLCLESPCH